VGLLHRFDGRDLIVGQNENGEDEGELADVESGGSDGSKGD
jgi:hypothetical protein